MSWELLDSLSRLAGCDEIVFIGINYGAMSHYFYQQSRDELHVYQTAFTGGESGLFWHHFQSSTHRRPWIPDEVATVTNRPGPVPRPPLSTRSRPRDGVSAGHLQHQLRGRASQRQQQHRLLRPGLQGLDRGDPGVGAQHRDHLAPGEGIESRVGRSSRR